MPNWPLIADCNKKLCCLMMNCVSGLFVVIVLINVKKLIPHQSCETHTSAGGSFLQVVGTQLSGRHCFWCCAESDGCFYYQTTARQHSSCWQASIFTSALWGLGSAISSWAQLQGQNLHSHESFFSPSCSVRPQPDTRVTTFGFTLLLFLVLAARLHVISCCCHKSVSE